MSDFTNKTHTELVGIGTNLAEAMISDRGYTTAELNSVNCRPDGSIKISFSAEDDFQKQLSWDKTVYSGYYQNIHVESLEELREKFDAWPTRERREFRVLADKMAGVKEFAPQLTTAAGMAFASEIAAAMSKYMLLEDQS